MDDLEALEILVVVAVFLVWGVMRLANRGRIVDARFIRSVGSFGGIDVLLMSSPGGRRYVALNYEIIVMLVGGDAITDLRAIEDANRALCRPLALEEWSQRSAGAKYVDTVMRLTSALQ